MNLKKIVLASAAVIAMSAPAYAVDPTASAVWTGLVSGSTAGDTMVITGLGGGAIGTGTITINQDGTFSSNNSIIMEARSNTGTLAVPVVGNLVTEATWTLASVNVLIPGVDTVEITNTTQVYDGSTVLPVGGTVGGTGTGKNTVDLSVANATAVTNLNLSTGSSAQVQVNMVASTAV